MRIILLGPPGSGKSVISRKLADKYGFPVVSVEEVAEELSAMAQQDDELGRLARDSIGSGRVSDDVCNIVIRRVLGKEELDSGFILVGYPKDVAQAGFMEEALNQMRRPLDLVLMIDIDRDELMERRVGRIDCDACGSHYNLYVNPPLVEGVCDMCGSRVSRRPRGYEENIANQLREYDVAVQPVLDFYRKLDKLRVVDANGTEDELWEGVQQIVDSTVPVVLEPLAKEAEAEKADSGRKPKAASKKTGNAVAASGSDRTSAAVAKKKPAKKTSGKKKPVKKTASATTKKTTDKASAKKVSKKAAAKKKVVKKVAAKKAAVKKSVSKKKAAVKKSASKKKPVAKGASIRKKTAKKKVVKKAALKKVAKKAAKKKVVSKKKPAIKTSTVKKKVAGKKVAKKKVVKKAVAKKVAKKKPLSKKVASKKKVVKKSVSKKKPAKKSAAKKSPARTAKKVAKKTAKKKVARRKR